jgi:purine catabolism regulator
VAAEDLAQEDRAAAAAPLTVAGALALPVLRRALPEVVAGEEHLDRPVRWVHSLDVADPEGLLRGGELVLATGLGPGQDPAAQRRFVRGLDEEGAAGLIIELGLSYRTALPAALVAEARARGLPLVATHRPVRFVDVTEAIHGALVDHRLALLRGAQEVGDRLIELVLAGTGLDAVLREVARTVADPVVLENLAGQLVAFALHESSEEQLLEAREEDRRAPERGELGERGRLSAEVRQHGRPWGQLLAFEVDSPLGEADAATLERAAIAVALELRGDEHEEHLRARARGSFLVDVMQGRLREPEAARRAAALDFPRRHGRLLPLALAWRSERWIELADSPDEAWAALSSPLRAAIGSERAALLGLHAGRLLIVCALADAAPGDETLAALAADIRWPLSRRGFGIEDVALAIGASATTWTEIGDHLDRVGQAALAARATTPREWQDARRSTIVDLLYPIRATPELLSFAREQLGPLFDERDARDRELLHTLEVYLQCGGRKAEAARVLHVERQSLYLRLERVEKLLGVELSDPDTLLGLHVALRALRLTQALGPEERLGR